MTYRFWVVCRERTSGFKSWIYSPVIQMINTKTRRRRWHNRRTKSFANDFLVKRAHRRTQLQEDNLIFESRYNVQSWLENETLQKKSFKDFPPESEGSNPFLIEVWRHNVSWLLQQNILRHHALCFWITSEALLPLNALTHTHEGVTVFLGTHWCHKAFPCPSP